MKRNLRKLLLGRTFYLHANRLAIQRGMPKVWTIHTSKGCFHAERIFVDTPLIGVYKPHAKSNPRLFLKGIGFGYWVTDSAGEYLWLTSHPCQNE